MRRSWLGFAIAAVLAAGLSATACATDANNVTACRQLEDARCVRAVACGIDLGYPLHAGDSPADAVSACQDFYYDACLHGLLTTYPPTNVQINGCLKGIETGSCNYVVNPQNEPLCSWLIPPDAGVDAGVDAPVPDVTVVVVVPPVDATINDGAADALSACYQNCEDMCVGDTGCLPLCEQGCQGM